MESIPWLLKRLKIRAQNRAYTVQYRAGIFKLSMGARNRVGIWVSYRPARLHRLAEFIPGLHKRLKIRAQYGFDLTANNLTRYRQQVSTLHFLTCFQKYLSYCTLHTYLLNIVQYICTIYIFKLHILFLYFTCVNSYCKNAVKYI